MPLSVHYHRRSPRLERFLGRLQDAGLIDGWVYHAPATGNTIRLIKSAYNPANEWNTEYFENQWLYVHVLGKKEKVRALASYPHPKSYDSEYHFGVYEYRGGKSSRSGDTWQGHPKALRGIVESAIRWDPLDIPMVLTETAWNPCVALLKMRLEGHDLKKMWGSK